MRLRNIAHLHARLARRLAPLAALGLFACVALAGPAAAEAPATTPQTSQPDSTTPAPAAPDAALPEPNQKASPGAPGVPGDATAETVEVPARPVALFAGDSEWSEGFKSITAAIAKVQDAVKAAGLKQAGPPFAVFLSTDDATFHFEAMTPLAARPEGKNELSDGVKLGESPSGRAIKFLHRGAYDDIDSTYDLITAYLDEKGLSARNVFIEEYLTPTKDSDDAGLEADIYVFLK